LSPKLSFCRLITTGEEPGLTAAFDLIDTHAHLDFPQYDQDREEVIKRAFNSGLEALVNISVDLVSCQESIELAKRYDDIHATVGVHPHDAEKFDDNTYESLKKLAGDKKVVGIGETGLDFYRDYSPREAQIRAFEAQIDLAKKLELPLVVHIRKAHREGLEILEKRQDGSLRGVLHCFSGTLDDAKRGLALGFYLAFGGSLTFLNSRVQEIIKHIPYDRILSETDCPYITPVPHRGKRNEPSYVRHVVEKMAELLMPSSFREMDELTTTNAKQLFGI
jgi:TatD DNase family protein